MSTPLSYQSEDILEAMKIREAIDGKIQGLYENRKINESAGFLLPKLNRNMKLLDCGCGPGQISCSFAEYLTEGEVVGIDANIEHVDKAKQLAKKKSLDNISIHHANIFKLPFEDNSFDVAFFHTVMCNIHDPITALKEVKRVLKPGGMIAAREPDYPTSIWFPENENLQKGLRALKDAQEGYSDALIGRKLKHYFHQAGFHSCRASASCDTYDTPEQIQQIATYLKTQLLTDDVYENIIEGGQLDQAGIKATCVAFDEMCENIDAMYSYMLVELIGYK